jgi:hypothetical protein
MEILSKNLQKFLDIFKKSVIFDVFLEQTEQQKTSDD